MQTLLVTEDPSSAPDRGARVGRWKMGWLAAASAIFLACGHAGSSVSGTGSDAGGTSGSSGAPSRGLKDDASGGSPSSGSSGASTSRGSSSSGSSSGGGSGASGGTSTGSSGSSSGSASSSGSSSSSASSSGSSNGATAMPAPAGWSYNELVWVTQFGYRGMGTDPSAPNQGTFVANGKPAPDTSVGLLNDWNFGNQESPGSVWSRSGSAPYWGSSSAAQTGTYASGLSAGYAFPGNVIQTSTGANPALFTSYSPQTFIPAGTGLTLQDHYVGGPKQVAIQSNGAVYYFFWSSAMINTEGKRYFPFGGASETYGQVRAQMAGPNNGSWSAIWMLPDQGANGTGQEIDIQEYNVSGADPYKMYSHVQGPAVQFAAAAASTPLYAGYHVYGWDLNSKTQTITVYLDGAQAGTFTGSQVGARYYLIVNANISSGNQAWQTQEGFVSNSMADMALGVAEIQIYQR
jgi:hypothetical protein